MPDVIFNFMSDMTRQCAIRFKLCAAASAPKHLNDATQEKGGNDQGKNQDSSEILFIVST